MCPVSPELMDVLKFSISSGDNFSKAGDKPSKYGDKTSVAGDKLCSPDIPEIIRIYWERKIAVMKKLKIEKQIK